jgi:hypothetical protein
MSETLTEQEARAFVGSNRGYYLGAWRPALTSQGGALGFNIAAFFFSGLWLGYRKMYKAAFILYGLFLTVTVLEAVLFAGILRGMPQREKVDWMRGLDLLVMLIVAIVVGIGGNRWYLTQARRALSEVRSKGLSEDAHLKALSSRGGTSLGVALGLTALFVVVHMFLYGVLFGVV